jgi:hypothetical protein
MPFADLPARHERSAPCFDNARPEEVEHYFADLQHLLAANAVVAEDEMKQAAVKYLKSVGTEKLWRTTPAFADAAQTYEEFKTEILSLYPSAGTDRTFSIQDLDMLIGERVQVGIISTNDVADYYRQFLLISRYLISKNCLSSIDQLQNFMCGFRPELVQRVMQRLELRLPTHLPEDPYTISEVYEAANFIIGGPAGGAFTTAVQSQPAGQYQPSPYWALPPPTYGTTQAYTAPPPPRNPYTPPAAQPSSDPTTIKIEALTAAVASLGEMLKTAIETQQSSGKPRNAGPRPAGATGTACNFCGGTGHFIRECEVVTEYSRVGKCKRGADGRVVLPSGAMVPRDVPGNWLRDRVDEWHRQNPGQAASQMILEVAAVQTVTALPRDSACQSNMSYPAQSAGQCPEVRQPEVYALRRVPAPRPEAAARPRPARDNTATAPTGSRVNSGEAAPPSFRRELPPHPQQDGASSVKTGQVTSEQEPSGQAHPYTTVQSTPHQARPAASPIRRGDQAYTTTAKIHDEKVASDIYNRAMELPITVTQHELLSLAPELRAQVADATVKRRIPREMAQVMIEEIDECKEEQEHTQLMHMPASFATAASSRYAEDIVTDTHEQYLKTVQAPADLQDDIQVAAESNVLRAILPIVDGQDQVEAILDPGCQVVAMSEEVCNALAIAYDPDVRLSMVSANGGVDQLLGLVCNVSFLVGNITLYLQVHILRSPAYDILLGRPFDILTQSVVCNYRNENQTITIKDPNSGKSATIPTVARGSHRFAERRARTHQQQQGF